MQQGPLFLSRYDVERLLKPDACATAVESAFRQHALGEAVERIVGLHSRDGSFHLKAGMLMGERSYFAAKVNANFPHNREKFELPTVQGLLILHDGDNGSPLAILDSISITALRTAAATAIAAKYLARKKVESALVCGCGAQAAAQARTILGVRKIGRLYVFDEVQERADKLRPITVEREKSSRGRSRPELTRSRSSYSIPQGLTSPTSRLPLRHTDWHATRSRVRLRRRDAKKSLV